MALNFRLKTFFTDLAHQNSQKSNFKTEHYEAISFILGSFILPARAVTEQGATLMPSSEFSMSYASLGETFLYSELALWKLLKG